MKVVPDLDGKFAAAVQVKMHGRLALHLSRQTLWFYRHVPATTAIADAIAPYAQGVQKLRGTFSTVKIDDLTVPAGASPE